jgi:DNA-binding NtrC family response regulator
MAVNFGSFGEKAVEHELFAENFGELVHECLDELCRGSGKEIFRITEEVARLLETHSWPGTVRELRSVLEYAVLACSGKEITADDLPFWFSNALH